MATKIINGKVKVFTMKSGGKYAIVSLPVDSLPRSKKLRILAQLKNKKFDAKAYSFSNWCMCHIPREVAKELKVKNNQKVKLKVLKILVK